MKILLPNSFCIYCMLVSSECFAVKKIHWHVHLHIWLYVHGQRETSGLLFQAESVAKWRNAVLLNLYPDGGGLETMVLAEV